MSKWEKGLMRCMMWCESIRAETCTCSSELVWSFSTEIHYQGGRSERNSTALEEETLSITLDRAEMWERPVITGSRQSNFRRNQKLQCNKWTKVELFHTTHTQLLAKSSLDENFSILSWPALLFSDHHSSWFRFCVLFPSSILPHESNYEIFSQS